MSNRLSKEKSPYLRQHQHNPVDWYPWGEEALAKAKKENKPVFLSIGYSTCHWCHVMEKESFEDPFVATLMNQAFVNVKVDREERPDIDHVYMTVCQMMTGQGGWPLTVIMTPEQKPFFAGTYIPKVTKHGHLGMVDLIPRIQEVWTKSIDKVEASANQITESLTRMQEVAEKAELDAKILHHGFEFHHQSFDETWGGFGDHPKFPSLHHLQFLLRYGDRFKTERAVEMAEATIKNILAGGIYDQVGGGIHRYSVDREWYEPHFEKMLYDQAMLLRFLSEIQKVKPDPLYATVAEHTVEYLRRDLRSSEGGYFSGEDADSEGEEGKFYFWSKEEIARVAPEISGFFQDHILRFAPEWQAKQIADPTWFGARTKLLGERSKRVRPSRDEKILTDWNGLLASALALAGRSFNKPEWVNEAVQIFQFIEEKLKINNELMHRYCEGETLYHGNIDDYSFLLEAAIEIYQSNFEPIWLEKAKVLADDIFSLFWNETDQCFYFTSDKAEKLIVRKSEVYDGAYPSGNSTAVLSFLKLAKLLGDSRYEDPAMSVLEKLSGNLDRSPGGYTYLLCALDFAFGPTKEYVISGQGALAIKLVQKLQSKPLFRDIIHWNRNSDFEKVAPFLNQLKALSPQGTFYLCENFACQSPVEITDKLIENL